MLEEDILISPSTQKELSEICEERLQKVLFLVLMPTEACNFRCIYCYERHDNTSMDSATIEGIKQMIRSLMTNHNFEDIQISWFGGEPTLCINVIVEIMEFVHTLRDVLLPLAAIHSTITTNGYNLARREFLRLLSCGVTDYQITLDGFHHDQKRPAKNGSGTRDVILNNLRDIHLLGQEYKFSILLRNNILLGDHDFEWYDFLYSLFGNEQRFIYSVIPVAKLGGKQDASFEVEEADTPLLKLHQEYMEKIGLNVDTRIESHPVSQVCFAAYPYGYLIRADGSIGKCTIELYDPFNYIGSVRTGEPFIDKEKESQWISANFDEQCCSCKSGLICLARTCPYKNHVRNGEHFCIR